MNSFDSRPVLSRLAAGQFLDRQAEIERICSFASRGIGGAALLLGAPRTGKSELLRKAFDKLFGEQGRLVPVYHALDRGPIEPEGFAREYLSRFLAHFVAFRRNEPSLTSLAAEPLSEVAREAPAEDYVWVRSAVAGYQRAIESGDSRLALQRSLSVPALAASHTNRLPLVLLDNVHLTAGDPEVSSSLIRAATSRDRRAAVAYILCGLSRPMMDLIPPEAEAFGRLDFMRIGLLPEAVTERLVRAIASGLELDVSDATVDLIIEQLNRDLFYIRAVLEAAAARKSSLKAFLEFERVYTEELLGGRIHEYLTSILREAAGPAAERVVLEVLSFILGTGEPAPRDIVVERLRDLGGDADALLTSLHGRELLTMRGEFIEPAKDPVLRDYVRARHRRDVEGAVGPIAGNELLGEKLKHSYRLVVSRFNRIMESRLVDLLIRFDCQSVPSSLFDDVLFEERFSGVNKVVIKRSLDASEERIRLPQAVSVSGEGSEERAGVFARLFAVDTFEGGIYAEGNHVCWLVALVSSNEPLDLETLGYLERRMEPAARNAGKGRVVRWYISKEGFSAAASARLTELGAYHSTYVQLDLLADYLAAQGPGSEATPASEFELVIPIEEESELIAARTAEQIARAASFDQQAINQIKTALIEACLNAAEHGDSPDRRIYNRFAVAEDRISISVSNRGRQLWFTDNGNDRAMGSKGRGRGLQIIRALMDEVRFERDENGTTLVMVKLLKRGKGPTET